MTGFTKRENAKLLKLGFNAKVIYTYYEGYIIFLHSIDGEFNDFPVAIGRADTRTEALKLAIKEFTECDKCSCGGIITHHHRICVKCGKYYEVKKMNKDELYKKIAVRARIEAQSLRDNAGAAGRHDDGGANRLEFLISGWESGLAGEIPNQLRKYEELVMTETDPEWSEYQRLHKKFNK